MNATYTIPAANFAKFEEAVARLNKRAARLGVAAITYTTAHAYLEREYASPRANGTAWVADGRKLPSELHTPTGAVREYLTLTVEGETPKYEGWEFIGTLSPVPMDDGPAENEVRATPGNTIPTEYRNRVGECDHCRLKRNRSETFVVRHDNGDHRMVGRTCIKDFLGHKDPHVLAAWAEILADLDAFGKDAESEFWGEGGHAPAIWDIETFLAVTAACIRKDGWLSRTAAYDRGGEATADAVLSCLGSGPMGGDARRAWLAWKDERRPTEKDEARAAAAVEWAKGLEGDLPDYLYNVNLLARSGLVRAKSAGIAASIIAAWDKETERRKYEARPVGVHVGAIKKRMEATVTVRKIISIEGYYGTTGLHLMEDADGNDIKWFASGSAAWLEVGETYRVKMTVKAHEEYKGRPNTVVNRVAVVEEIPAA